MVGATGFEPATTCTPSKCATRLRHAPLRHELGPYAHQSADRQANFAKGLGLAFAALGALFSGVVILGLVGEIRVARVPLVEGTLQHLARAEGEHPACGDLNLLTCLRVAAHAGLLLPDLEIHEA